MNLTFFTNNPRFSFSQLKFIKEGDFRIKFPLILLSLLSISSGYLFYDLFVGYGGDLFNLNSNLYKNHLFNVEYLSQLRKFFPFFFVLSGSLTYIYFHNLYITQFSYFFKKLDSFYLILPFKNFLSKKWFFDFFYYHLTLCVLNFSYEFLFKSIDRGILEDFFIKKPIYFFVNFFTIIDSYRVSDINFYLIFSLNIVIIIFISIILIELNINLFFLLVFYIIFRLIER